MLSLARVRFDPFEMDAVARLQTELASKNIGLVLDPAYSVKDKPILNYINPHIRIDGVDNVLYHHDRIKCSTIISRNIPVSFMPVENKYPFYSAASLCFYCKPPVDAIPILMITHARHLYLELTLNALAFSITYDPQIPVHILMSKPTEEVKKVVQKFKSKLNLYIYETEENVCFAGFNMLLQHVNPEKFISLEEDFILPQHIKTIMPYWNRIFNERLNYFDVVGFSTSVENVSADHFSIETASDAKQTFLYDWKNNVGRPHVTGNTLCTTKEHYIRSSPCDGPYYITPDGALILKSKWSICSITGYHIGFNQEMDIGVPLTSNRFPNPNEKQSLFDYQKNEKFEYTLTDLFKGYK